MLHFADGHAWVSLNSIQHAITARNCMSSRLRYKGSTVQFWPDECAEALRVIAKPEMEIWKPKHQIKMPTVSVNRFDGLLEYDDDKEYQIFRESGSDA